MVLTSGARGFLFEATEGSGRRVEKWKEEDGKRSSK